MKRYWMIALLITGVVAAYSGPAIAQDAEEEAGFGEEGIEADEYSGDYEEEDTEREVATPTDTSRGVETYWGNEDLEEIELGFFMDMKLGYYQFLTGDTADMSDGGFTFGFGLGGNLPIPDFERLLELELDVIYSGHAGEVDLPNGGKEAADFHNIRLPLVVTVAYSPIKRLDLFLSVLGGINFMRQTAEADMDNTETDGFAGGRLGLEYYTGLRHFSIGLELEVDYMFAGDLAIGIMPGMKYTF